MIKQIANGIVYVSAAKCSAIYCFDSEKVYSINEQGTQILNKYIKDQNSLTSNEKTFITQICELFNISNIKDTDYKFPEKQPKQLDLAWLEVTQRCSSRCIHCYEGTSHHESERPLTFEEWKKVIEDLSILKCKQIQFIGGEPSLYSKLPMLIDYATTKGIESISVFTNLYTLSKELLSAILRNNCSIHFSIYGAKPEIHNSITQVNGCFENMLSNMQLLLKHKVNLTAHVVIMKENENDRDNIYSLLSSLGITTIRYDEVRKVYGGCQSNHLVKESKANMTYPNFSITQKRFNNAFYRNTCWYGKCVVSTNGDVYPCEFEHSIVYGNMRENSLVDIIFNSTIDKYWYWDFSKVEFCKDCEFRFACKDCRPLAYAENGEMSEKNPRCKYNPYTGIWNKT